MNSEERIEISSMKTLREEISSSGGNEIVWRASLNREGFLEDFTAIARGNAETVVAVMSELEQGDVVVHNHPSGDLRPSQADLQVASRLGNSGVGFCIIDNYVTQLYVVVEPIVLREIAPLKLEELLRVLQPKGRLSTIFPTFQPRLSQQNMLERIVQGFNENQLVVAEAGTGVGKSLSYLLPALQWAEQNEERVLLATATIPLQQQILEKDIPLAVKALELKDIRAVLVKGRGNYLCLKRLEDALNDGGLFFRKEIEEIKDWSENAMTGERSEMLHTVENQVWSNVCGESDSCSSIRCPFYSECFIFKAKKKAASANVLVANHHMLFADLSVRESENNYQSSAVLPAYQRIIIDEAHNVEQNALTFFSAEVSRYSLYRKLNKLHRYRDRKAHGYLNELQTLIPITDFFGKVQDIYDKIQREWDGLEQWGEFFLKDNSSRRITPAEMAEEVSLCRGLKSLNEQILTLCELITRGLEQIDPESELSAIVETNQMVTGLELDGALLKKFLKREESQESEVFWLELKKNRQKGDSTLFFHITPLSLAKRLSSTLLENFATVLFTSATLSINHTFDYWGNRVGLQYVEPKQLIVDIFPSPFDYENRVLLAIPRDVPEPNERETFSTFAGKEIVELVRYSGGSALVLFTSFQMLSEVYEEVFETFASLGIPLYRQGDRDRHHLLDSFKSDVKSTLFATDSFWQGIDAPGETLRLLILCRLPFARPNDPVKEARYEEIEREGRSPFQELSLPEAVVKFKQGFGRLMRNESDRGVVCVLDRRLITKQYGRLFLQSLPPTKQAFGPLKEVNRQIAEFYE